MRNHPIRAALAPLLLGCMLAAACSDDPVTPGTPPPQPPIVWNQLRGGLGVGEIRSIWGTSPQNVLAVHATGILHYDGNAWRAETIAAPYDTLCAVWGASSSVAFACGDAGVILRRDGSGWSAMTTPTSLDVRDICGTSTTDVYAVAASRLSPDTAELLHYDGSMWAHVNTRDGVDANAVFVAGGTAFMVCDGGVVVRYDGTNFTEDTTYVTESLFGVWAASATDAYAVGASGRILHFDGSAWTPMTSGVPGHLRAVSGSASNDMVATGDNGVILHGDGTAWTQVPSGSVSPLTTVWLFPTGEGVVGGDYGTVVVGAGTQWAPRNLGRPVALEAVWSSGDYFMAAGAGPAGGEVRDRDGYVWSFPEGLHAIAAFSSVNAIAAGDGGAIYQFDGFDWEKQNSTVSSTLRGLTALVSRFGQPFRVYAVGDDGTLLVWKVGVWSPAITPAGAEDHQFVDVWAAAIDDVFAVACNATSLVRYDDPYEVAGWTLEDTPASAPLLAVGGWRGDVYIASAAGEIFFNNGNGWTAMASPVTTPLRDIRALSKTSIFAVGDSGVIVHYDGRSWRETNSKFAGNLMGIWGGEDRAVFAVGTDGAVLLHNN